MQLTINIPKELYEDIQRRSTAIQADGDTLENAVLNGIPLPQNHGDLKDMDDIYEALEGWNDDTGWIVDAIDFQTETIVEADEGE